MEKNTFVEISFKGKVKETGNVFDSVDNIIIVAGRKMVLPALDDIILTMNVGEKRNVEIQPSEAFGIRDDKLIKLIPVSEFKRHNMTPYPGMYVNIDNNMTGRVLTINSGRATVDFNHPLAGKVVEYEVEVKRKVDAMDEKIRALLEFYSRTKLGNLKTNAAGDVIEIQVPPTINPLVKKHVADEVHSILGFKEVRYVEVFNYKGEETKGENA